MAAWRSGFDLNEPSAEDEDDPAAFDEHYVAAFNLEEHNAVAFDLDETRSCGDGERETQPDCNDGKRGTRGERRASGERPASGVHPAASEHEARGVTSRAALASWQSSIKVRAINAWQCERVASNANEQRKSWTRGTWVKNHPRESGRRVFSQRSSLIKRYGGSTLSWLVSSRFARL